MRHASYTHRYDSYKQDFYKLCTKEFADVWINNITELRK